MSTKKTEIEAMTQQEINPTPIYDGPDSTMLSWNGTCPERPEGDKIAYFRQPCPRNEKKWWKFTGEIWVCDRDFSNHRKVFEMPMQADGFQHNGGMQTWIDNNRLVFRHTDRFPLERFYVVDVNDGSVLHEPIYTSDGGVGKYAIKNTLPFGISSDEEVRDNQQAYPNIDEPGIYMLDCDTGQVSKIVSSEAVVGLLLSRGYSLSDKTYDITHVMTNFDFTRVMARWVLKESTTVVSCDPDGGNMVVCPDRPLHILWFDNETYFGADETSSGDERRRICRYRQDGTKIETLAGQGNHIDGSPDRQWFVGDSKGFDWAPPHRIRLFRRGETEPAAELGRHEFDYPVMRLKGHANPVFSRDGKRVYFNHMVDETHALACCADISAIVEADG